MTNHQPDNDDRTPRWVKAFGVVALILVLLFVILHLTGGGFRGHGAPAPSSTEQGMPRP